MKIKAELIYEPTCPNIEIARSNLLKAAHNAGVDVSIQDWDKTRDGSPAYTKTFGSPTILLNGEDVVSLSDASDCCRLYPGADGKLNPAPSVQEIEKQLLNLSGR